MHEWQRLDCVMHKALKIFGGLLVGVLITSITGNAWLTVVPSFFLGCIFQFLYAHSLNTFLEGRDPVQAFGTKNLHELRSLVSLPVAVLVLDFMAKVFMVGGVTALLFVLGILNSP